MRKLTIGQMAKINHVSEQTLRLYDKMGLLSPLLRGDTNNYRYYDIRQSAVLDMIRHMKSLGISLNEIKQQLDKINLDDIESILNRKQSQIQEEIHTLELQQRAISRTSESIKKYRNSPPDGTIALERIETRQMYCVNSGVNFYDYNLDIYETILRDLLTNLVEQNLPQIYFCNAGSILRKRNFILGRFYSTEVFVFVDPDFVPHHLITEIPAGDYLCIYCDDFYKEKEYAKRLLQEISKMSYKVTGDYICEVIAEIPMIQNSQRGMFLRLQVPVQSMQSV